jgi:glucose/arabinose dehydrogenase
MNVVRPFRSVLAALALLILFAIPSFAQFRGQVVVSGLTHPLAFVQDPSNAAVQYVVEQEGLIRVVRNGALLPTPFLDVSAALATGGEKGLVGLAFPPSYAETGRFFISFVNTDANLVVARFVRSADPLIADPASRFDLQWSDGNRFIWHPAAVHYGGNLVFGADGYLYLGTGDGGESNDPNHRAQTRTSLLGKVLRIDVNVGDEDVEGFDIPAGNPFASGGGAPEVWSVGFRNPWRFSMDDPARGGTGGFVIADVGESRFEEINYEPPSRAGRNYGWRNREGAHDFQIDIPASSEPLTEPIYEYDHGWGRSITGGFVYRGSAIPSMRGRYVFGDFVAGRIASVALTIDPETGEAVASDMRDHTSEITAGATVRTLSSFGVDATGELYAVNWSDGTIVALRATGVSTPILQIDTPGNGSQVRQPFALAGWALDANSLNDPGISTIHVWAFSSTGTPYFLGVANLGAARPDVGAYFGPQFNNAGYGLMVKGLPPGTYQIGLYGLVSATQTFAAIGAVTVSIEPAGMLHVDLPASFSTVSTPFVIGGWAIDPAAVTGTGVATIHVWAFKTDGTAAVFLGTASFGNRPDIAAAFGPQFANAGFGLIVNDLPVGTWHVGVYGMSSVSGLFDMVGTFFIHVP